MFANDHALIDLFLRANEHAATLFKVPQGIGHGLAIFHRDQNACAPTWNWPFMGRPFVKNAVQHACTARIRQEFPVIAD